MVLAQQAFSGVAHALLLAVVNEYSLPQLWGQKTQLSGRELTLATLVFQA